MDLRVGVFYFEARDGIRVSERDVVVINQVRPEIAVEPRVDFHDEEVLPVRIDSLRVVEIVGEELQLRLVIDIFDDGVFHLRCKSGAELETHFVGLGMDVGIVRVEGVDTVSSFGGETFIVDNGQTAGDGREVDREVLVG